MNKFIKSKIKLTQKTLGLQRVIDIIQRCNLGKSYYSNQLRMIWSWCLQDTENVNFYYDITDLNRVGDIIYQNCRGGGTYIKCTYTVPFETVF